MHFFFHYCAWQEWSSFKFLTLLWLLYNYVGYLFLPRGNGQTSWSQMSELWKCLKCDHLTTLSGGWGQELACFWLCIQHLPLAVTVYFQFCQLRSINLTEWKHNQWCQKWKQNIVLVNWCPVSTLNTAIFQLVFKTVEGGVNPYTHSWMTSCYASCFSAFHIMYFLLKVLLLVL